jgi:murein DD-endopeptidase MepM/ murein hydrolase activator NlpD
MATEGSNVYAITDGTIRNINRDYTSEGGAKGYLRVNNIPTDQQTAELVEQAIRDKVALRDSFHLVGDDGYTYYYTHLQPNSTLGISNGSRVCAGDYVGKVGDYAASDFAGSHLHISAAPTGSAVDKPYGKFTLTMDILPILYYYR